MNRVSFAAFACGKRASGKSFLIARYARAFPRRILYDPNGEYLGVYPGAAECGTLGQTLDALERLIDSQRWIVVSCMDPDDVPALCKALAPAGVLNGGYSRAVGGVMLECGEVDTIAPNNAGIAPEVRNIFQRGRHYRVSVVTATQRPRDVHRVVTSQTDVLAVFRQHEERDLDYVSRNVSAGVVDIVKRLPQYAHLCYMPQSGNCAVIDKNGKTIQRVNLFDGSEQSDFFDPNENEDEADNGETQADARDGSGGDNGISESGEERGRDVA